MQTNCCYIKMITNEYINYIYRSDSDGVCTIDNKKVSGSENMKRGSQGRGRGTGQGLGRGCTSLAPGKLPSSVIKPKKTEQKEVKNLDLGEQPKKKRDKAEAIVEVKLKQKKRKKGEWLYQKCAKKKWKK